MRDSATMIGGKERQLNDLCHRYLHFVTYLWKFWWNGDCHCG